MNKSLAVQVIQSFLDAGGDTVCVCAGSRNAPIVSLLAANPQVVSYHFYEERSAAFFALGLSRRTKRPVAVVTTSGTAAVELMPAITEAYYAGVPLLAITADRPRSYRGTNAPQSCEQVGLYGLYAPWSIDMEGAESLNLQSWNQSTPAHINVCFNEPLVCVYNGDELSANSRSIPRRIFEPFSLSPLTKFLETVVNPLVIVGAVEASARDSVRRFLIKLNAPVYFDGISGLREESTLVHLRVSQSADLWGAAEAMGYPIDGVLRIGGVPTVRLWRDLEDLRGKVSVCSVNDRPFSGLSWSRIICAPLDNVFDEYEPPLNYPSERYSSFLAGNARYQNDLEELFREEPNAEPSLIHEIAKKMPEHSFVYLGNGLPVREWDLAAPYTNRKFDIWATRGLSGIDGQTSTFLGLCLPNHSNWAFIGDLTTLYDMAGFWIASQLKNTSFNFVVVNNSGGQIFSRMYKEPQFLNTHSLQFKALAELWGLDYQRWEEVPDVLPVGGGRLIELVPDNAAYKRFWDKLSSRRICAEAIR